MPPIGRQAMLEGQLEDGLRLARIVKCGDGRLEPLQVLQQPAFDRRGLACGLPIGKKRVPVPLESRVRLAAGEVQVAEDFLQDSRIRLRRFALRRGPLYFHVVSKPSCTRFGKMNAGGHGLRRPARLQSVERSTTLTRRLPFPRWAIATCKSASVTWN